MRIIIIGILSVILIASIIIWFVLQLTSGVTEVADQFFTAVSQGDLDKAYALTSQDFQAATSRDGLQNFLRGTALLDFQKASWTSRSVSGNQGELQGSVTTRQGGEIPVKMTLIKESGGWKILSMEKAAAGIQKAQSGQEIPPDEILTQLTNQTMQDFAWAVNVKNFNTFHQNISKIWQKQISPEELYRIFQSFADQEIDLTVLQDMEPLFSEVPSINAENILILTGYYPSQPNMTYFTFKYIYEHPRWKLFGINVEIK